MMLADDELVAGCVETVLMEMDRRKMLFCCNAIRKKRE
jgi:hypothetical protein